MSLYNIKNILNFIGFQLVWWLCVFHAKGEASGDLLFYVILAYLANHYFFILDSKVEIFPELVFHLGLSSIGIILDTILIKYGVLKPVGTPLFSVMPAWLFGIWLVLPTLVLHSLRWTQSKSTWLQMVLGLSGILTYIAGESLGILKVEWNSLSSLFVLIWASFLVLSQIWSKWVLENYNEDSHSFR